MPKSRKARQVAPRPATTAPAQSTRARTVGQQQARPSTPEEEIPRSLVRARLGFLFLALGAILVLAGIWLSLLIQEFAADSARNPMSLRTLGTLMPTQIAVQTEAPTDAATITFYVSLVLGTLLLLLGMLFVTAIPKAAQSRGLSFLCFLLTLGALVSLIAWYVTSDVSPSDRAKAFYSGLFFDLGVALLYAGGFVLVVLLLRTATYLKHPTLRTATMLFGTYLMLLPHLVKIYVKASTWLLQRRGEEHEALAEKTYLFAWIASAGGITLAFVWLVWLLFLSRTGIRRAYLRGKLS